MIHKRFDYEKTLFIIVLFLTIALGSGITRKPAGGSNGNDISGKDPVAQNSFSLLEK